MAKTTTFAERLRALREEAGLTMYALAKASGVSKQALSKIEAELVGEVSWTTVQRLAQALGAPFEAFADPLLTVPVAKKVKRK